MIEITIVSVKLSCRVNEVVSTFFGRYLPTREADNIVKQPKTNKMNVPDRHTREFLILWKCVFCPDCKFPE
jgi:hypothetical protein